ncbi:MAG: NADH-quinone oxidoreductase subunit M, partial [Anaerolineaceae bacterium]|nr:NADH-quinone oxidoreductase subunit M [Anaerolineaceae bacterium]
MNLLQNHLLSWILILPTVGAVFLMLLPAKYAKVTALLASMASFGTALILWLNFDPLAAGFQFEEQVRWYADIHASYHLGVDGISLMMVLLT